jgi:regulator of sigma E protease
MDCTAEKVEPVTDPRHPLLVLLQPGDRIVAVDGTPVSNTIDLLKTIQNRNATIIVQKAVDTSISSWKTADSIFESSFKPSSLKQIISNMGTAHPVAKTDNLVLLPPVSLKPYSELALDPKTKAAVEAELEQKKKMIEKIENADQRQEQMAMLEESQKRLMLGAHLSDRKVAYNPSPLTLFGDVVDETWKTLTSLLTGFASPKALSGPVGMVKHLQTSWSKGFKDALYWLGFISLNLAFINLIPIPVLDGGHIVFATIESITKKPLKAKTMEKLILPFIILFVILFVYLTYNDIVKLLRHLF